MTPPTELLQVSARLAESLRVAARDHYPRESCGFLLGTVEGATAHLARLRPAVNRADRADRFVIDARQVFEAQRAARAAQQDLLGVYHSHPCGSVEPSAIDAADAWGGWLQVIVACSREATEIACWRWDGEAFAPVACAQGSP